MPLSEHEQRLLEQIERSLLDEDPKFASTVRAADPRHHTLRRMVLAVLLFLCGIGLLVFGLISRIAPAGVPVLGIGGFVLMVGGAVIAVRSYRRGNHTQLRVVGASSETSRPRRSRSSLIDRLEERWNRRRDDLR